jgi:hypothetical protein
MSHTYSVFRILFPISVCLFIAFSSCRNKNVTDIKTTDSVTADTNNSNVSISDSSLSSLLDKSISDFSGKHSALNNWSMYSEANKINAEKVFKNRNLVFPLFREQIMYLHQSDVTDTILVYYGNKSNTFVIKITKGEPLFDKLNKLSNGLMIVKVISLEYSQKLYLVKKHTEFEHKEKKVTEFYITAELIDAANIGIKDKLLREKFNLED